MIVVNARFLTQQVTGVQRFAIEISKKLSSLLQGKVVFVTPLNILQPILADELGAIIIGKRSGTIWEQIDLRNYLNLNHKPLLINFCNTGVIFYKRQIATIHDMSYKVNPLWFSRSFYLWYNFLIPHLAKHCKKILTVSNSSKNDIVKYLGISHGKIDVVYNASCLNTNDKFDRIEKGRYILTVSSLNPRKNLNNLLAAFNFIESDVKLIIVGLTSKSYRRGLNADLLNKNIIIKGYQTDGELASLMKYAEAFVYVSFYEGFGLPPLEAMSVGCPVIVSDIPAHREVCNKAALYVNPYRVEDIKNNLREILSDGILKQALSLAGKRNAERFNWAASAEIVIKSINEVI